MVLDAEEAEESNAAEPIPELDENEVDEMPELESISDHSEIENGEEEVNIPIDFASLLITQSLCHSRKFAFKNFLMM